MPFTGAMTQPHLKPFAALHLRPTSIHAWETFGSSDTVLQELPSPFHVEVIQAAEAKLHLVVGHTGRASSKLNSTDFVGKCSFSSESH